MGPIDAKWGWAKGLAFFSGRGDMHLRILIGIGVLLPLILQFLMAVGAQRVGAAVASAGPSPMMRVVFVVMLAGSYVLQLGSFFASWSLGFHREESAGGAIGYGIFTALIMTLICAAPAAAVAMSLLAGTNGGALIALLVGLPLLALVAALYTTTASAILIGFIGLVLAAGVAPDFVSRFNQELAVSGQTARLACLVLAGLLLWLTARLSCTAAIMADHARFGPLFSIAESWRLTAPAQWRIMVVLGLAGLFWCLVSAAVIAVYGSGMISGVFSGAWWIGRAVVGVPFAILAVLVPAGIYRELRPFTPEEEIFV